MATNFASTTETFGRSDSYTYDKKDYIARGTFGIVYKGKINNYVARRGETVAVKVVHMNKEAEFFANNSNENWAKLRSRLQKLISLEHDHLATYQKVSITMTSGGAHVELMMHFYAGGDLGSLIKKTKNNRLVFEESDTICFSLDIAEGLKFLHENNIIHGDLKPRNVLLSHTGQGSLRLLIGDLDDLVQMQQNVTTSGDISHFRGTVRYMSPEMLKKFASLPSETPGRKTDVWSLGCVMLELAGCTIGNYEKRLVKGTEVIIPCDKIPDTRYATMVIDGYVPFFVPEAVPKDRKAWQRAFKAASVNPVVKESLRTPYKRSCFTGLSVLRKKGLFSYMKQRRIV